MGWSGDPGRGREAQSRPAAPDAAFSLQEACWFLALAAYALFLFHRIDLTDADLGRHLKNGEWFLTRHSILATKFYSYTFPEFPAVNHHWGSGVLFCLVWKLAGFSGLSWMFAAVSLATFGLFYRVAEKEAGAGAAFLAALLVMPLLWERLEIRPEALSYLFCGAFFRVLWDVRRRPASRWIWLLPALEVLWVNCHIYFFLGPGLVGLFWLAALAEGRPPGESRRLLLLLCAVEAATLATPFGIHGALAPLEIFHNMAFAVLDNQSILTLIRVSYPKPNVSWFVLVFALSAASFVFASLRSGRRPAPAVLMLAAVFSAAGWLAVRNLALFGFFILPILALNLRQGLFKGAEGSIKGRWVIIASIALALLAYDRQRAGILAHARDFGTGLQPGNLRAAEYFRDNHLRGPIMNNYDIGGYLIFTLPDTERVFVDNRPEAYPASFFTDTYIPMQNDDAVWRREDERRHFNVIYFDYRERSTRCVRFLARRLQDPQWAPVYADGRILICLRRAPANAALIRRDEIPRSRFVLPRGAYAGA
jgi:hypothetical protein